MTKKQFELLRFIRNTVVHMGVAPTYKEMKNYMKVSSNQTIHDLLLGLEREDYIQVIKGENRGIKTTSKASEPISHQNLRPRPPLPSNFTSVTFSSSSPFSFSRHENGENPLYGNNPLMKGGEKNGTT